MQPEALLIVSPAIDFGTLLTVAHQALGYSPAKAVDSTRRQMTDAERYVSILAACNEANASVGFAPHLLNQLSYTLLVICGDRDLLDILEVCSGMPFVPAETVAPGVSLAVISGTLAQWRDVVRAAATLAATPSVRICFSKILLQFDKAGLSALWADCNRKQTADHTGFYLEDKRK